MQPWQPIGAVWPMKFQNCTDSELYQNILSPNFSSSSGGFDGQTVLCCTMRCCDTCEKSEATVEGEKKASSRCWHEFSNA